MVVHPYQNGFRKLIVWQEAHKLAVTMYKIAATFPEYEKFGVTSQVQRAASSVSANIAEGTGRKTSSDQNKFYVIARGSLVEVDNFLELVHDLKYISDAQYQELIHQVNKVGYLLSHLINRKTSRT